MKLNIKIRLKNKTFWMTFIPMIFLLVYQILNVFGIEFDLDTWQDIVLNIVSVIFMILSALGIVVDPTTDGISDSDLAMTYEEPKKD